MYCIDVYLFTVGAIEVTYINIRYAQWINIRISACWELLLYHVPDSRTPQLLSPHTPGTLVQGRVEGVGNTIAYRCLFLIIFAYICHVWFSYHVCNLYITCILYIYIYIHTPLVPFGKNWICWTPRSFQDTVFPGLAKRRGVCGAPRRCGGPPGHAADVKSWPDRAKTCPQCNQKNLNAEREMQGMQAFSQAFRQICLSTDIKQYLESEPTSVKVEGTIPIMYWFLTALHHILWPWFTMNFPWSIVHDVYLNMLLRFRICCSFPQAEWWHMVAPLPQAHFHVPNKAHCHKKHVSKLTEVSGY